MSVLSTAIAEKTRDLISISSSNSLFLCHDLAGTTLADSSTNQIFNDVTVNGTTAGIWAAEGEFTPFGDHAIQQNSTSEQNSGILSTASQLVFYVDFYATTNPTTQNMLLMYGRTGGGGAHAIKFSIETNGRFQLQHVDTSNTVVSINSGLYGSVCDSQWHSLVAVIDIVNGTISTFVDGIIQGTNSIVNVGDTADSRGWCMFANMTSNTARNNYFGANITGAKINRFGLIRFETDNSGNIGNIATGLSEITHELPWELNEL